MFTSTSNECRSKTPDDDHNSSGEQHGNLQPAQKYVRDGKLSEEIGKNIQES